MTLGGSRPGTGGPGCPWVSLPAPPASCPRELLWVLEASMGCPWKPCPGSIPAPFPFPDTTRLPLASCCQAGTWHWDPPARGTPMSLPNPFPGCHGRVPPSILAAPRPVPLETHPGAEAWGILSRCSPFNPPLRGTERGLFPVRSPARSCGCWGQRGPPFPASPQPSPRHTRPMGAGGTRGGHSPADVGPTWEWGALQWGPQGAPGAAPSVLQWCGVVRSVGYGVSDVGCPTWDAGFGIWDARFGMWDAQGGIWDVGCRMWNARCGMQP